MFKEWLVDAQGVVGRCSRSDLSMRVHFGVCVFWLMVGVVVPLLRSKERWQSRRSIFSG